MKELETIEALYREALEDLKQVRALSDLERVRVKYLGRGGKVRDLFALVARAAADAKKQLGERVNRFKSELEEQIRAAAAKLEQGRPAAADEFDVTVPGARPQIGRAHPVYRTMDEICAIFQRFGFEIESGPEIETDFYNFEALNMPRAHPSRDPWDSFYIEGEYLLRSHTSPVQIRAMQRRRPPLRILAPGKVYRPDKTDASHLPQFHQVEGLMVGEDVTFAQLRTVLDLFAKQMFGKETQIRFRPSYFPFTEPSAEVDVTCVLCRGQGCPPCKGTGWLEILGCGMVHPNVFRNVGYDPEQVTGFAFGMGVERIAMLRWGINDIRLFLENRYSFLKQF